MENGVFYSLQMFRKYTGCIIRQLRLFSHFWPTLSLYSNGDFTLISLEIGIKRYLHSFRLFDSWLKVSWWCLLVAAVSVAAGSLVVVLVAVVEE